MYELVKRGDRPVIQLNNISKEYRNHVVTPVLHEVEFALWRGEFAALTGPSGSGKSTLLNIMGLLDRPSAGTVYVLGHNTQRLSDDALTRLRGRTIGFVFQFHHLLPGFTAAENVFLPMAALEGSTSPAMKRRAVTLLEEFGLGALADKDTSDLSGGEQQRVAIARALALNPELVLADEPTGNLDTRSADKVLDLMESVNRTAGTTFLIVTHNPAIAARCQRVIDLVDGKICEDTGRRGDRG